VTRVKKLLRKPAKKAVHGAIATSRAQAKHDGLGTTALPHAGEHRICKKCDQVNEVDVEVCAACGSTRLAPSWVLDRRAITKQFEVQITESSKEFGDPEARITLSKWWPNSAGRSPTLHITNPEHWVKIRDIVETEFAPRLGWTKLDEKAPSLPSAGISPAQLRKLVRQHPGIATQALAEELGPSATFSPEAIEMVRRISKAQEKLEQPYIEAYQMLIEKLPSQGGAALLELGKLLEGWSLHQVTQVTGEAKRRLQTIALFERLMLDDDTYEIRGDSSIHRVLEGAM
jgi:RNA polymerase subunit RPABC4/transcription elongation factor Spt4